MTTPLDLTERAAFEAHRLEKTGHVPLTWERIYKGNKREMPADKAGLYFGEIDQAAWEAWQAAIASRWQPIETAPRDGKEILLGRAESEELDSPSISVPGYWQEGYEDGVDYMGCDSGFVDSHHQTFSGGRSFGDESHRYAPNQPTHWQPLPAPPTPQDPPIAAKAAKETT